ncbi:MAG: hypothetical protein WCD16_15970 [Paracoccaceae bacterium]
MEQKSNFRWAQVNRALAMGIVQVPSETRCASQLARRYAMNANLIFKGLRDSRYAPEPPAEPDAACFLPVEIVEPPSDPVAPPGLRSASCSLKRSRANCHRGGCRREQYSGSRSSACMLVSPSSHASVSFTTGGMLSGLPQISSRAASPILFASGFTEFE